MKEYIINFSIAAAFGLLTLLAIHLISKSRKTESPGAKDTDRRLTPKQIVFFVLVFVFLFATAFFLLYFYDGNTLLFNLVRYTVLSVVLCAAYFDLKSYIIPNSLIVSALILRLGFWVAELVFKKNSFFQPFFEELISAIVLMAVGLVCAKLTKNSIGMGDVKLFFVLGLFFGAMGSLTAIFLSLIVSFFVSVFLLITKKKRKTDVIPFAPSVLIGTFVAIIIFGV